MLLRKQPVGWALKKLDPFVAPLIQVLRKTLLENCPSIPVVGLNGKVADGAITGVISR